MAATTVQVGRTQEDVAKIGDYLMKHQIEPRLAPEDTGKFVAIAIDNGDYEMDDSDQKVMKRIISLHPHSKFCWRMSVIKLRIK